MRVELSNELTELINELGPQVWDDFDHVSFILYLEYLYYRNDGRLAVPHFSAFFECTSLVWNAWHLASEKQCWRRGRARRIAGAPHGT